MKPTRRDVLKFGVAASATAMLGGVSLASSQSKTITGLPLIDEQLFEGLPLGGIVSVIGYSGSGKSALIDRIIKLNPSKRIANMSMDILPLDYESRMPMLKKIYIKAYDTETLVLLENNCIRNHYLKGKDSEVIDLPSPFSHFLSDCILRTSKSNNIGKIALIKNRHGGKAEQSVQFTKNGLVVIDS